SSGTGAGRSTCGGPPSGRGGRNDVRSRAVAGGSERRWFCPGAIRRIGLIDVGAALLLRAASDARAATMSDSGLDERGIGIEERRTRSDPTVGMLGRLFGLGGGWPRTGLESIPGTGDGRAGTTATSI